MLKTRFPHVKVIIISNHYHEDYVSFFMSKGARAFLPKRECESPVLLEAIHTVKSRDYYFDDSTSLALLNNYKKNQYTNEYFLKSTLTERQKDIIRLIFEGCTSVQIAERLNLEPTTINFHKKTIYAKTGTQHIGALLLFALRAGIITLSQDKLSTDGFRQNHANS